MGAGGQEDMARGLELSTPPQPLETEYRPSSMAQTIGHRITANDLIKHGYVGISIKPVKNGVQKVSGLGEHIEVVSLRKVWKLHAAPPLPLPCAALHLAIPELHPL